MVKRKAYPEGLLPKRGRCAPTCLYSNRLAVISERNAQNGRLRNAKGAFFCGERSNLSEMIPRLEKLDCTPGTKPANFKFFLPEEHAGMWIGSSMETFFLARLSI